MNLLGLFQILNDVTLLVVITVRTCNIIWYRLMLCAYKVFHYYIYNAITVWMLVKADFENRIGIVPTYFQHIFYIYIYIYIHVYIYSRFSTAFPIEHSISFVEIHTHTIKITFLFVEIFLFLYNFIFALLNYFKSFIFFRVLYWKNYRWKIYFNEKLVF